MRAWTRDELRANGITLGPDSPLRAGKPRARPRDLEHPEQREVVRWAIENERRYPDLKWLFAVPNFSGRLGKAPPIAAIRQGARLKAEGRKKGVLDLWLPARRRITRADPVPAITMIDIVIPGLAIEMKAGNGKPTKEQREWIDHLAEQGWWVKVCWSATDAIAFLERYLRLPA